MKGTFLLSLSLLLATGTLVAQKNGQQFEMQEHQGFQWSFEKVLDTVVSPPISAFCVPYLETGLLTQFGDQVGGTNYYRDMEKAQLLIAPDDGMITGVLAGISLKWQGTANGTTNYNVKIYSYTPGGPGTLLATSQNVAYSAIDTVTDLTLFPFSPGIAAPDSFIVSLVVDNGIPGTDSIALLQLYNGSDPTDVCGLGTAWELQGDTTWHFMNGLLNIEWGVDLQFLMAAIINVPNSGVQPLSSFNTYRAFPNPAGTFVNLSYSLNQFHDVKISITDITGKTVYQKNVPSQTSGAYNQTIDVSGFSNGLYQYTIATATNSVTGKFIVQQ